MIYTKKQFAEELQEKIMRDVSCDKISKWAFEIYIEYGLDFEDGLDYFVLKLIAMEEGPEFFLSKEKLKDIVKELFS